MEAERRAGRPNPSDEAGALSTLFFWWTVRLFRDGYSHDLAPEDLCDARRMDRSALLGNALEQHWLRQEAAAKRRKGKPNLRTAILKTFGAEYVKLGILVFITDIVLRLAQPQLLGGLLAYFELNSTVQRRDAYLYAGGIVLCAVLNALCANHYLMGAFHTGMRVRAACCALIYRKALRLSQGALGRTAAGQMVNLLSNDVSRFDLVSIFLHYMWAAPLAGAICAYFMYREVGWPAFTGIAAVFVVVPLQAYTGHLSAKFRHKTAVKTDERVRLMDEIISGIQVIKMYAWEKPFAKLVAVARRLEIRVVTKTSYIRGLYMTFGLCTTRIALACTLSTMAFAERPLPASQVFVVLSYFNILSQTMSMMFVRGIAEVAETIVSTTRLQDFMCHEELQVPQLMEPPSLNGQAGKEGKECAEKGKGEGEDDDVMVAVKGVTARWEPTQPEPILANVDLEAHRGQLIAVIGQVGAGKSSLLYALLGELPAEQGSVRVRGRVAYASQEAWVFAATVRQNILFGRPLERQRYERVVRACALQRDFEQLPRGDLTVVGQRGAALSGGQKARINLARAVYAEAPIYLLDDPLSAVDAHVGKHLFDECICGYLAGKTRILITHQLQHIKDADHIIVMNNGRVEMQGDFAALSRMVDYAQLLGAGPESEEGAGDGVGDEGEGGDEQPEAERERSSTPIHQLLRQISTRSKTSSEGGDSLRRRSAREQEAAEAEAAGASAAAADLAELSSKGRIQGKSVYLEYFRAGGTVCGAAVVVVLFLLSQVAVSGVDWFVSYWTTQEEIRELLAEAERNKTMNATWPAWEALEARAAAEAEEAAAEVERLADAARAAGAAAPLQELLAGAVNATRAAVGVALDPGTTPPPLETKEFAYVFLGVVGTLFLLALTRSLGFYTVAMRCSERLHAGMFRSIIRARMRFFDTNPSGRILNRFSKDIGSVDELLPKAILDAGQIVLMMLGSVLVSVAVNYYFIIPVVVMGVLFWYDRKIYLKTSKNVKRVEGITKSPVFTHLHATLQGLTTVRASGAQDILRDEFDRHQDLHSSAWFMFMSTSAAFGFSLDVLVLIYITIITFSFLVIQENFGGSVGLAITQAMALTGMMQWGMRQSAEVANNMMSVERVLEYSLLEEEPNIDSPPARPAPKGWPRRGELRLENVFLRYSAAAEPVLRGLTLTVQPGEKVGVVGRTGAGKSSLIAALFRLAWGQEGRILIDGEDTAALSLAELRARLSIIPQDPVLFSGTLRRNLDPFGEFPDAVLYQAVHEVELRDSLQEPVALDAHVAKSTITVGCTSVEIKVELRDSLQEPVALDAHVAKSTIIVGCTSVEIKVELRDSLQEPVALDAHVAKSTIIVGCTSVEIKVELRDSLQEPVALDAHVAEGGSNFSVGQRQLVCLARAILRNNKVLVLDEATANVDPHTDSLIQHTIRAKFKDCTVLTVAHRLNTIMDSDKVLVMDFGQMVEYDHPHILLQNKDGHFYSLVQETGRAMADQLAVIAEDCYLKKQDEEKKLSEL